jgi:biopolymer transport protein ExbD
MPNGSMLIIWPDGAMARVQIIDSSTANAAMRKPRKPPTIVIVEDGHAYLVPDRKLDNGKTMSDTMSDTTTPGGHPGHVVIGGDETVVYCSRILSAVD